MDDCVVENDLESSIQDDSDAGSVSDVSLGSIKSKLSRRNARNSKHEKLQKNKDKLKEQMLDAIPVNQSAAASDK